MGEEREAEDNEQEESDKEELDENKGELDEGNKRRYVIHTVVLVF